MMSIKLVTRDALPTQQMINKLKVKSTVQEKDLKPLQFALAIKNMGHKGGQCNGHMLSPSDLL